jgi:hypothetical protein
MPGYKPARDLKLNANGKYSMSLSRDTMVALEKIAEDLEKVVGVPLTRMQVIKHLIALYQTKHRKADR